MYVFVDLDYAMTTRSDTGLLDETNARLQRRPLPPFSNLRKDLRLSLEFFPPATGNTPEAAMQAIHELGSLAPDFVSVTYGAGGSAQHRSLDLLRRIQHETQLKAAAHLTCVGAPKSEIDQVIEQFAAAGVRHIVALRGDPPAGASRFQPHPLGYHNAAELVAAIRARGDFEVSVAAYPQVHPEALSWQADLDNLKRKIDAGASRAISQFFFDPEVFLRFHDRARAAGISIPIVPGILPIHDYQAVSGFARRCGATIPGWLQQLFLDLGDIPEVRPLVAATVAAELCTRLQDRGIRHFHFYTLNRSNLTRAVCHILGRRNLEQSLASAVNG